MFIRFLSALSRSASFALEISLIASPLARVLENNFEPVPFGAVGPPTISGLAPDALGPCA